MDKYSQVVNKLHKGDKGKELKLMNDAIVALLIRQDNIIKSMTPTQKTKFDELSIETEGFTDYVREVSIKEYNNKKRLFGKLSILEIQDNEEIEE